MSPPDREVPCQAPRRSFPGCAATRRSRAAGGRARRSRCPHTVVDEHPAGALQGVRPGLVERLAGADVPVDLASSRAAERHRRSSSAPSQARRRRPRPRRCAPRGCARSSSAQHPPGVGGVGRLAEDLAVDLDGGVGADRRRRRARRRHGRRLVAASRTDQRLDLPRPAAASRRRRGPRRELRSRATPAGRGAGATPRRARDGRPADDRPGERRHVHGARNDGAPIATRW